MVSAQEGAKTPTSFQYYENNTVVNGQTQPNGAIQTMTRPTPGTSGGGTVSYSYTYSSLGNMLTATGPGNDAVANETVTFNYTSDPTYNYTQAEALNQPLTRTDTLGHIQHFRYDSRANKTAMIDANGHETDVAFNLANQGTVVTFAATGVTGNGRATVVNTYGYVGGPQTQTTQYNESGVQVWQSNLTYGNEGEPTGRSGGTQPVSQTYDAVYRLKTLSDGDHDSTQYTYNQAGYLSQVQYANGDTYQFPQYDLDGDPLQRIDANNVTTTLQYNDPESRLTNIQYPVNSNTPNVSLNYDGYGRRVGVTDGTGSQTLSYDDLDEHTTTTVTYTGLAAQSLTIGYNPDGSRSSLTLPDLTQFSYHHDAAARLTGLTNPSGQQWSWSYQNNDWLSQQVANSQAPAADQVVTTPTRNNRGFITDLNTHLNNTGQTLLTDFGIGYNSTSGNIGSLTASIPAAPGFGGTTQYSYDNGTGGLNTQITQETSTRNGGYTSSFAYDQAGNANPFRGASFSYNTANQIANAGFAYDHNGNPVTYHSQSLTFDAENRLTAYGTVMTAGYRADGLRAWKQTSAGKTYYLYDGDTLVLEENSSGTKTAVNTFGPSGLLARTSATRTLLYLMDPQGNVAQQVDASSGTVVASYCFDAWGARSVSSSDNAATSEPYTGFGGGAGYYSDWETGLQLLGHRYYDPAVGRFLTRDPASYTGGVNLYEYCGNSPFGSHDASGTDGDWINKLGKALGDIDGGAMAIECLPKSSSSYGRQFIRTLTPLLPLANSC